MLSLKHKFLVVGGHFNVIYLQPYARVSLLPNDHSWAIELSGYWAPPFRTPLRLAYWRVSKLGGWMGVFHWSRKERGREKKKSMRKEEKEREIGCGCHLIGTPSLVPSYKKHIIFFKNRPSTSWKFKI